MKYLLTMICLVVMVVASASYADDPLPWELVLPGDGTQRMPTFLTSGAYNRPVVQNPSYAGQPLFVNGWFADFFAKSKKDAPIPFELINIIGKSRLPFPDCTNPSIVPAYGCAGAGATGFVKVWYEKGLPGGRCYMPGGTNPYYHILWVFGSPMQRGDFKQWWLQTDSRWANDPYGRNGISSIRAYGCCLTCAAMQLSAWGWDYTPGSLATAMRQYKDGFTGKSGLQFNWDRLQKMTGCGYRGRVAISEMLERGMTTQAGVRHNSKGVAGHWLYPWANAFEMLWYIVCDPMGRGSIDREVRRYDDKRDNGCWEYDTRSVYRKSYGFNFLLSDGPIAQGAGVKVAGAVITGPVKIDEEYLAQNMGRIAPCLLMKEYLAQRPDTVAATAALSASPAVTQTQTISEPPDESALVDWGYWGSTGFVAWAESGDVHLKLKSGGVIVAEEKEEISENDMTEEVVTDLMLEVSPLKGGTYTLEITGVPGTVFEVQTYRYLPSSEEAVDILISGTIDQSGVYNQLFTQIATALVIDIAGLQYVPEGSRVLLVKTNVTAKIGEGRYALQSDSPLAFPTTMNYAGTDIQEFGQYQVMGIVGPNRTITVSEAALYGYTYSVNCPPVYRTNKRAFDEVAGYLYTKLAGKVSEVGDDYFVLDNTVRVKMADSIWLLIVGTTISVCGVPVDGEFVANAATVVTY